MGNLEHFRSVAKTYSEQFFFDPYYEVLIGFLEKYTPASGVVVEIGAANGIVAEQWDKVRKEMVQYYSVDPVEDMIVIARHKAKSLSIIYRPFLGNLENAWEVCGLKGVVVDVLLMSRSLHEIYINYGRDIEKLSQEVKKLLNKTTPSVIICGDAMKNTTLTAEETERFILAQKNKIGHGHDPSRDYLSFQEISEILNEYGYLLREKSEANQPLEGFEKRIWNFGLGIFVRDRYPNRTFYNDL